MHSTVRCEKILLGQQPGGLSQSDPTALAWCQDFLGQDASAEHLGEGSCCRRDELMDGWCSSVRNGWGRTSVRNGWGRTSVRNGWGRTSVRDMSELYVSSITVFLSITAIMTWP